MCVYYLDPGTLVQWLLLVPSFMACVISAVGLMIVFGFTAFTEVHCYLTLLRKRSGVHPGFFFSFAVVALCTSVVPSNMILVTEKKGTNRILGCFLF